MPVSLGSTTCQLGCLLSALDVLLVVFEEVFEEALLLVDELLTLVDELLTLVDELLFFEEELSFVDELLFVVVCVFVEDVLGSTLLEHAPLCVSTRAIIAMTIMPRTMGITFENAFPVGDVVALFWGWSVWFSGFSGGEGM